MASRERLIAAMGAVRVQSRLGSRAAPLRRLVLWIAIPLVACGSGEEIADSAAQRPPRVEFSAEDLVVGSGPECADPSEILTIHYRGMLLDGSQFDSSYERGAPIVASLDSLIPGWQRGMPGMRVGGKRRLTVPADLAYSGMVALQAADPTALGAAGELLIPPESTLVFEVELLDISDRDFGETEGDLAHRTGE